MGLLLAGDMELAKPTVTGSPVTIQEDDNGAIDSGYKVSHNNKPLTVSPGPWCRAGRTSALCFLFVVCVSTQSDDPVLIHLYVLH